MAEDLKPFQDYLHAIEKKLAQGDATEHTHRAALETLVVNLDSGIMATNEPKHIGCGAPDLILILDVLPGAHNEAKACQQAAGRSEYYCPHEPFCSPAEAV